MPVYDLKLKAELENVESISATDDTLWRVKIECSNCQEVSPSFIEISSKEQVDVPGTRGVCNCLYTCKSCKRKIQIDVAPKSLTPYTDSEKSSKIVSFEVRGGKPCEYQPADGFTITAQSGAVFEDVDLQDDFADYDG
ncbi:hypothetical protein WA171_002877 [Blastocystis sp. BT1]